MIFIYSLGFDLKPLPTALAMDSVLLTHRKAGRSLQYLHRTKSTVAATNATIEMDVCECKSTKLEFNILSMLLPDSTKVLDKKL